MPLGIAVLCLLGAVLTYPHLAGLWHLEIGGTALDAALGETDSLDWWYVGSMAVRDGQALQRAILHLEKATRHAVALRLLGRAHAAQGDLLTGIEALEQFAVLRPENAMGHLELAAAYARTDQRLQGLYSTSLIEALPGAAVSAPDLPGETVYRPEGWYSDYAYPTAFLLAPDTDKRATLFLHAGSQVTFTLSLTQPAVLSFALGLDPQSLGWDGDGVTFEVFVDGTRVFLEHLPVEVARGGWQERQVDLSTYAGQTIALSLASTPGPVGDVTADWSGWGEPRVEVPEAAVYRQVVRGEPWLGEWAAAGVTAGSFVSAGEGARKAEKYEETLAWYQWALRLDMSRGDLWYYVGLIHEDQQQWQQSLTAYENAVELGHFRQVHRSSPHYRIGNIYQRQLNPRQEDAALTAYETAIRIDRFSSRKEEADCHFKRGEILWWQKTVSDEYIAEFQQAIALNPDHAGAHILLGITVFERNKDAGWAEAELLRGLELAPQNKWAYYHLGEIYRQDGLRDEARAMYERAISLDPEFEVALEQLATLDGSQ
jgi:tetratricopeptide (TPR) repeat protein